MTLVLVFIISKKIYKRKINPMTIYTFTWFFCFFIYSCGIIKFIPINWETFWFIYGANLCVVVGCIIGKILAYINLNFSRIKIKRATENKKGIMKKVILWTSILAAIEIIPNVYESITQYGFNLIANTSTLYFNELSSTQDSAVSLSAFIFVTAAFLGMYISDYGFDKSLIIPIVILSLFAVSKGSRGTFVIIMSLVIAAMTLPSKRTEKIHKLLKHNRLKKISLVILFVTIIIAITMSRQSVDKSVYANYAVVSFLANSVFVSIFGYFGSGIGCLDQFLFNPIEQNYPRFFFRVFFILFNKLGITSVDTEFNLPTYYIPMPANVITYIGELYYDFGNWLFLVIIIMAMLFSVSFCKAQKNGSIFQRNTYAVMFTIFTLSFFANFGHTAGVWYALILGGLLGIFVDNKIVIKI
jgi:oligosaccharide repeat unit polymerase